jgi:hypothetical protein
MLKGGLLSVSAGFGIASTSIQAGISLNQVVLTTIGIDSERLATWGNGGSITSYQSGSWTGQVKFGDIIRIYASSNPGFNAVMSLSFQEQEIQVSVSNTLPQFSESDSSVRLDGANGFGSTNTLVRRFSNQSLNLGNSVIYNASGNEATAGAAFTIMEDGIYSISYFESMAVASSNMGIVKNQIQLTNTSDDLARERHSATAGEEILNASWTGYLSVGDIIRPIATEAAFNNARVSFTISKVGKPNVTGVDVTPFVNVPQPESQSVTLYTIGNISQATNLASLSIESKGQSIFTLSTSGVTLLKNANVNCSLSANGANVDVEAIIYVNGQIRGRQRNRVASAIGNAASASINVSLNAGDKVTFVSTNSSDYVLITLTAEALSDQILTPPETFSTDIASLTYASSSLYNLTTLADAPVGTFITFTYAANTNTRTQTTTAPTQSVESMNQNGIQIFTRAYNAASTAGNPAAIAIQIGKGLKGVTKDLYKSVGKVTSGSLDYYRFNGDSNAIGCELKNYNEITGVLLIDTGVQTSSNTSSTFRYTDLSTQSNGYLVINASKNPALTGLNSETVSARVVNTAGTTIGSANTKIAFDSSASIVNNMTIDNANNRIYAPHSGIYWIDAGIQFASAAYTAGHQIQLKVFKNGVYYSTLASKTVDAAVTQKQGLNGSDQIRLTKGDYIEFYATNARGNTALSTTAGECYMNITKKGL